MFKKIIAGAMAVCIMVSGAGASFAHNITSEGSMKDFKYGQFKKIEGQAVAPIIEAPVTKTNEQLIKEFADSVIWGQATHVGKITWDYYEGNQVWSKREAVAVYVGNIPNWYPDWDKAQLIKAEIERVYGVTVYGMSTGQDYSVEQGGSGEIMYLFFYN